MAKRAARPCGVCESLNQPALCPSCINLRLIEKYKLLKRLRQDREALHSRLNFVLKTKRKAGEQLHRRLEHAEHVSRLQDCLLARKEELVKGKTKREQMQSSLERRMKSLESASTQLTEKRTLQLGHHYPDLIRAQKLHHIAIATEVSRKRRQVIRELCKVLPLWPLPAGDVREQGLGGNALRQWSICGARLPNGEDIFSLPPHELSASLGYMVHLVNLGARYLSAPLLHYAVFAASSSRIWQTTSCWDVRPASCSDEYPLFVSQKGSQSMLSVDSIQLDRSHTDSGYLSLEKPSYHESGDHGMSSVAFISTRFHETHSDVEKGINLLRRSIACILTYGYHSLSLPVPLNLSTYEALAELLSLFSAKEGRLRTNHLSSVRYTFGNGSQERRGASITVLQDEASSTRLKNPFGGRESSASGSIHVGGDGEDLEGVGEPTEGSIDGWDLVEHPTLPPPPSLSEDVEHWTRAMFVDATK